MSPPSAPVTTQTRFTVAHSEPYSRASVDPYGTGGTPPTHYHECPPNIRRSVFGSGPF